MTEQFYLSDFSYNKIVSFRHLRVLITLFVVYEVFCRRNRNTEVFKYDTAVFMDKTSTKEQRIVILNKEAFKKEFANYCITKLTLNKSNFYNQELIDMNVEWERAFLAAQKWFKKKEIDYWNKGLTLILE